MEKGRIIEVLNKWNLWNRDLDIGVPREGYTREILKFIKVDKIISVVGVRRSGKSTLLSQAADLLTKNGVEKRNILIVNFEEPEFEGADAGFLQRIYEAYLEIVKPSAKPFLILDEIQNVSGWERFVRSLNERKEAFVTISGSSSKLLSQELASVLTGRQIYVEVFPLSFGEFLTFAGVGVIEPKDAVLDSVKIRGLFREYMGLGGFPEVVLNSDPDFRAKTLRSYYEDIVGRDIIQRFKVRKPDQLKALARFYLTNVSSLASFNRISKFIKLPVETVKRFSYNLEAASLIFFVKRFSWSVKEQENSPRKIYSIDNGISAVAGFRFTEGFGKAAENLVAIELKRRQAQNPNMEVFYWRDYRQREVDFVVKEGLGVKELIQVCWDVSWAKEREIKPLLSAMKQLGVKTGLVLTEDYEDSEEFKGKILFKPIWKWMLGA